jgi:hypothetical protein
MSDYQWKSNEPVVTPPRPRLLLSDMQLTIFWALANAFGLAVGFFLGIGMGNGLPNETIIAGSIISAILIGWIEMLLLMLQRVQVKWWWIVNTTVGFFTWGAAFPILRSVNLVSGVALGLLLGMFQYINLRNRVEHASYWIVANIIGWGIALAFFPWLASFIDVMLVWAICGLIGGALTGFVMSRLVHQPQWEVDEAPLRDDYQS